MPLAHVRYRLIHNGNALDAVVLRAFGPALRVAIAKHFTCEGGELTEDEIEVYFDPASEFDCSDYQVVISLEGMHFQARQDNFGDRVKALGDDIRNMLPAAISFGLWVKLNNAKWYESAAQKMGPGGSLDSDSPHLTGAMKLYEPLPGHFDGDNPDPDDLDDVPDSVIASLAAQRYPAEGDDAYDPKTGRRPSDPVNWGYAGPR